jgi:hypothetical protein
VPIDTTVANSPGWWLARLIKKLEERRAGYDLLERYYTGDAVMPTLSDRAVRESYRRLMALSRTNFAELVVEAVRERMNPVGFRTGADGDELGDKEAWRIWQANALDADSALVHRALLTMGDAYVIVGGLNDEIDAPLITPEDPREVITEHDPIRKRSVVAALKVFHDDILHVDKAYLYLPGFVLRAGRNAPEGAAKPDWTGWEWLGSPARLPARVVPVVRFTNRADLKGETFGEFEPHVAILDRINYTILNRLEIATMQAFKQRAIKGVPLKDAEGNEIDYNDIFSASPGTLWLLPETGEIWESGEVTLDPIRNSIRDDIQDLAAVTRTPLFYLTPEATNGSAEGASLAREGLVFKTEDRLVAAGESWEQVMSLAFTFAGDEQRASRGDMEVMWASPERFSLAERYDAASKAQAAGVPWREVMLDILQFSPQTVDRMEVERQSDALLSAALAPPATATPVPGMPNGAGRTPTPV